MGSGSSNIPQQKNSDRLCVDPSNREISSAKSSRNGFRSRNTVSDSDKPRDRVSYSDSSSGQSSPEEEEQPYDPNLEPVAKLTDEEKKLLVHSWNQVERDADRIGAVTFMNLFERNPEVKSEFIPFKSIEVEDEVYNRILRNHGLRVLSTVAKMIHRVNEEEKMIAVVKATGTRHGKYNAKVPLIDVMCPHFVSAISETIGDKWNQELESAYNHLFSILSFHMRTSLMIEHHKTAISEKKKERQKK